MKFTFTFIAALATLTACSSPSQTADNKTATTAEQSISDANTEVSQANIKGVRYIGLTVSDIDETLEFYNGAVPYKLIRRDMVSASEMFPSQYMAEDYEQIEIALVEARNVFIQLVDFKPNESSPAEVRPVKGPGYTHVCYISPASDSAFPKFRQAGMTMVTRSDEPVDLGGYGMRYAYGLDPNGAMLETEVADKPRRDGGPWVGHIGSATPDADRMSEFYTAVLGYGPRRRGEYSKRPLIDQVVGYDDAVVRSSWFVSRNLEIEFWEYIEPRTLARDGHAMLDALGYNMIAYEVDDLDAEKKRLSNVIEFTDVRTTPFGWRVATGQDPDGNLISFQQRLTAPDGESIDNMLWIDPKTF